MPINDPRLPRQGFSPVASPRDTVGGSPQPAQQNFSALIRGVEKAEAAGAGVLNKLQRKLGQERVEENVARAMQEINEIDIDKELAELKEGGNLLGKLLREGKIDPQDDPAFLIQYNVELAKMMGNQVYNERAQEVLEPTFQGNPDDFLLDLRKELAKRLPREPIGQAVFHQTANRFEAAVKQKITAKERRRLLSKAELTFETNISNQLQAMIENDDYSPEMKRKLKLSVDNFGTALGDHKRANQKVALAVRDAVMASGVTNPEGASQLIDALKNMETIPGATFGNTEAGRELINNIEFDLIRRQRFAHETESYIRAKKNEDAKRAIRRGFTEKAMEYKQNNPGATNQAAYEHALNHSGGVHGVHEEFGVPVTDVLSIYNNVLQGFSLSRRLEREVGLAATAELEEERRKEWQRTQDKIKEEFAEVLADPTRANVDAFKAEMFRMVQDNSVLSTDITNFVEQHTGIRMLPKSREERSRFHADTMIENLVDRGDPGEVQAFLDFLDTDGAKPEVQQMLMPSDRIRVRQALESVRTKFPDNAPNEMFAEANELMDTTVVEIVSNDARISEAIESAFGDGPDVRTIADLYKTKHLSSADLRRFVRNQYFNTATGELTDLGEDLQSEDIEVRKSAAERLKGAIKSHVREQTFALPRFIGDYLNRASTKIDAASTGTTAQAREALQKISRGDLGVAYQAALALSGKAQQALAKEAARLADIQPRSVDENIRMSGNDPRRLPVRVGQFMDFLTFQDVREMPENLQTVEERRAFVEQTVLENLQNATLASPAVKDAAKNLTNFMTAETPQARANAERAASKNLLKASVEVGEVTNFVMGEMNEEEATALRDSIVAPGDNLTIAAQRYMQSFDKHGDRVKAAGMLSDANRLFTWFSQVGTKLEDLESHMEEPKVFLKPAMWPMVKVKDYRLAATDEAYRNRVKALWGLTDDQMIEWLAVQSYLDSQTPRSTDGTTRPGTAGGTRDDSGVPVQ